jgi:tRNA (guanine37-N1)-methyltransferase
MSLLRARAGIMKISVLATFSKLFEPFLSTSLVARAQQEHKVSIDLYDYFSYCADHERIDTPTFGHGAGMIMKPEVVQRAIDSVKADQKPLIIFFSPQGKRLDQILLQNIYKRIVARGSCLLITSRYEGIDDRVQSYYQDEVISIGDYVLMGGELPAMVFMEALLRLIPGVIGKAASVEHESFSGPFLDRPEYGAPVVWKDKEVPHVIRSGDHAKMEEWRQREAVRKTVHSRFDWLRQFKLSREQQQLVSSTIPSHYCALMHSQIVLPDGKVGTTSTTSLDLHDIARSSRTFNIENYFVVTPLEDQQKIIRKLQEFWLSDTGISYNPHRHDSMKRIVIEPTLEDAIEYIVAKEGKRPLVIATSAQEQMQVPSITYYDQGMIWQHDRPVLFVFGTGRGLAPEVFPKCDYLLVPIEGLSDYNHLSVRSAVAIIFDRWLGLNRKYDVGSL